MEIILKVLFILVSLAGFGLFAFQLSGIWKSVKLGKATDRSDSSSERIKRTILIAFGQKKMFSQPWPAILHGFVYVGFLVINIELLEILIDGIFGTHRVLGFMGPVYDVLMGTNEILGFLVIIACVIFLWRRNVSKVKRLTGAEMSRWPKLDGNIILVTEIVLMIFLFGFNVGDILAGTATHGAFPVSNVIAGMFTDANPETWAIIGQVCWWGHFVGILAFMNYLPISKHFHIIMAFPNTYYSKLEPKGQLDSVEAITHEIKYMMDPTYVVPAPEGGENAAPIPFGAKDVKDLDWTNLMDAWTCTECGRCSDVCPANITGKKLSPRKIIMDTRDRLEELKKAGDSPSEEVKGNVLLGNYISNEELWACTTCNACTEACPVSIDHVSEIVNLRRFLVLEESSAPVELNVMFTNLENNGCPWPMPASTRFDWAAEISVPETV